MLSVALQHHVGHLATDGTLQASATTMHTLRLAVP